MKQKPSKDKSGKKKKLRDMPVSFQSESTIKITQPMSAKKITSQNLLLFSTILWFGVKSQSAFKNLYKVTLVVLFLLQPPPCFRNAP